MLTITLDTNVLIDGVEVDSAPDKQHAYRTLRDLHDRGVIAIGFTTRLEQDKANDPEPDRVERQRQEAAQFTNVPGPARWDISRWGFDAWGSDELTRPLEDLFGAVYGPTGRNNSVWDNDHLHGHAMAQRDYFLTYDKPVLKKAPQLFALGIRVWHARPFVATVRQTEAALGPDDSLDELLPAALDRAFRTGL